MAFQTFTFDLELQPGGAPPVIYASAGDIGRPFQADLYWNGEVWTATGTTAKIRGKKPDKTVFDYSATVDGSSVTFSTTEQMTIISGPVECELVFTLDSSIVATANFVLVVEESPYDPDALSESDIPGIADLIEETIGGDIRDEVDALIEANPDLMLQDNAVTTAKIADSTVSTAKLADSSVTTDKIADSSVTSAKISDGAVSAADIADGAITTDKLASGAVTLAKTDAQRLDVYFLVDPSQDNGDTSLIVTKNNKVVLIDVGTQNTYADVIAPKFEELGITHIDAFIVSHYHLDHVGGAGVGAAELIGSSYVDNTTKIFLPHSTLDLTSFTTAQDVQTYKTAVLNAINARSFTPIYPTEEGETYELDEFVTLSFYNVNSEWWPEYLQDKSNQYGVQDATNVNYNNFSMCCMVANGENHYFFSGDVYELAQSKIANEIDYVNVYKVEHHGVNSVVDYEYLEKINPKIAVACISIDNFIEKYNMVPSVAKFAEIGEIYTTGDSGEIHIIDKYGEINATSEKGSANGFSLKSSGNRLSGIIDLNDVTIVGNYDCRWRNGEATVTNAPLSSTQNFSLWVIPARYRYVMQIFVSWTSRRVFWRDGIKDYGTGNVTWSDSWTEVITASEILDKVTFLPTYIENSLVPQTNWKTSQIVCAKYGKLLVITFNILTNSGVAAPSDFTPIGKIEGYKFVNDVYGAFVNQGGNATLHMRIKFDTGIISYYATGTTGGRYRGQLTAIIDSET